MASTKEIRDKIKIIQSTQKITSAMEMVAASKMRRAQEQMQASRPYCDRVKAVISHLVQGRLEYEHAFLEGREVTKVGFVVITTDRGLCGGLNANLFRKVLPEIKEWQKQNVPIQVCTIGRKSHVFFSKIKGLEVVASSEHISDTPSISDVIGPVKVMLDAFNYGNLDKVFLCFSRFVNTMQQEGCIEQLLPVEPCAKAASSYSWDYIYEPSSAKLLDQLLTRYIESLVYQAMVENLACEQAARMVAMKSATDNAEELIADFLLAYNKARQAAITKELSEIVGGAAAV